MTEDDVNNIRRLAVKIEPYRKTAVIFDDMLEGADDWRSMGEMLLQSKPWMDFRPLAQQNKEQFDALHSAYAPQIESNPDLSEIMEIGTRLIAEGLAAAPTDLDGCFGSRRIVRETFSFLRDEYGLAAVGGTDPELVYASDFIRVEIGLLPTTEMPLAIISVGDGRWYGVADILFMADRTGSLELAPMPQVATEAEAETFYRWLAQLLRRHCAAILAGVPGALQRLHEASVERQRLLLLEIESHYIAKHGSLPADYDAWRSLPE